jgi:nucleoside-diphosphate-sugar epimerase
MPFVTRHDIEHFIEDNKLSTYFHLWLERLARALVDFIAVQIAGLIALIFVGARGPLAPSEASLAHFYFHIFLPVSLVFPLVHSLSGLYTRLRGYALGYKLRSATLSAFVATLLLVFVTFLLGGSQLSRSAAIVFGINAIGAAVGVRWMKDWLFHRESEQEQAVKSPVFSPATSDLHTVLVVGGAGYIGSLVVDRLLARGCKVRLLDNLLYGNRAIERHLSNPNLDFIQGDCRNIQDVVRAMSHVKDVVHLAAIVGDPACAQDDASALQINYAATRMMLEIAKGYGIERFVFASSCSVYGASDSIVDEKSETIPVSLYAETKLHSESVLLEAKSRSFHPTVLRFATVFGLAPRPRFDLVVNLLTAKAIQDGIITIYNGDQWRPFLHANDVAEAVALTLRGPIDSISGEIFNVGDDRLNFTLAQVAEKIRLLVPQTRVEYVENADRRNYRVSFQKIRDCLGFAASCTIEDGILEIKQAFERGEILDYRHPFYSNVSFLKEHGRVLAKTELDVKVMAAFAGTGARALAASAGASASGSGARAAARPYVLPVPASREQQSTGVDSSPV